MKYKKLLDARLEGPGKDGRYLHAQLYIVSGICRHYEDPDKLLYDSPRVVVHTLSGWHHNSTPFSYGEHHYEGTDIADGLQIIRNLLTNPDIETRQKSSRSYDRKRTHRRR